MPSTPFQLWRSRVSNNPQILSEFILAIRHDITDLPARFVASHSRTRNCFHSRSVQVLFVNGVQREFVTNRCHWIVVVNLRQRGVINSHFQRGFMMSFSQRDVMIIFLRQHMARAWLSFSQTKMDGWHFCVRNSRATTPYACCPTLFIVIIICRGNVS